MFTLFLAVFVPVSAHAAKIMTVTVNGEVVTELGTKVMRTDVVKFHDDPVLLEKKVYVLLNKPKDYVTTRTSPRTTLPPATIPSSVRP